MKRSARCWICGDLFEAERGSLPKGARFTCAPCVDDGLQPADGAPLDHTTLTRVLYERHAVPYLSLADLDVPTEVLLLVHEDFARHHAVMPVMLVPLKGKGAKKIENVAGEENGETVTPGALVVVMADPGNEFAVEAMRRASGLPVQRFVSTWAEIVEAIGEQYLRLAVAEGNAE